MGWRGQCFRSGPVEEHEVAMDTETALTPQRREWPRHTEQAWAEYDSWELEEGRRRRLTVAELEREASWITSIAPGLRGRDA